MNRDNLVVILFVMFIVLSLFLTPYYMKRELDKPSRKRPQTPGGKVVFLEIEREIPWQLKNLWLEDVFKNDLVFYPILAIICAIAIWLMSSEVRK